MALRQEEEAHESEKKKRGRRAIDLNMYAKDSIDKIKKLTQESKMEGTGMVEKRKKRN